MNVLVQGIAEHLLGNFRVLPKEARERVRVTSFRQTALDLVQLYRDYPERTVVVVGTVFYDVEPDAVFERDLSMGQKILNIDPHAWVFMYSTMGEPTPGYKGKIPKFTEQESDGEELVQARLRLVRFLSHSIKSTDTLEDLQRALSWLVLFDK